MQILITLLFTCLLLTGCTGNYYSSTVVESNCSTIHSTQLEGEIIDGYYHDPRGVFSFKVPEVKFWRNIEEYLDYTKDIWNIQTSDFYGSNFTVDIAGSKSQEHYSSPKQECQEIYKEFFDSKILTFIGKAFPDYKLLEERFIKLNDCKNAYYGLFYLPCGSRAFNTSTNSRYDTRRALLISFVENLIVLIHAQEPVAKLQALENNPELATQYNQELYDQVIELRNSFKLKQSTHE